MPKQDVHYVETQPYLAVADPGFPRRRGDSLKGRGLAVYLFLGQIPLRNRMKIKIIGPRWAP